MTESTHIATVYNPVLVALSWAVALFAAYSALSTVNRLREGNRQFSWLIGGAISFGLGVWAMHFVGMSALNLGFPVSYNLGYTLLSAVISSVAGGLAFAIVGRPKVGVGQVLSGGLILGAGIGGMHYLGMAAMVMEATLSYDMTYFLISVAVAVSISSIGLWMMTSNLFAHLAARNLLVAAVVGAAIPLMHYAGMLAAVFTPTGEQTHSNSFFMALLTTNAGVVVAILVMALPLFVSSLVNTNSLPAEAES